MMYPSPRRKRALTGMLLSICLVILGTALMAIPQGGGRGLDGVSAGMTSTGLVGGIVSWVAARRN